METEDEIVELLKGLTIKLSDTRCYTITDEQAKELAHELYINGGEFHKILKGEK